jgi:hypothetical protein
MVRGIVYDPPTFGFPILVVVVDGDNVVSVEPAPSLPVAEARLQKKLRSMKDRLVPLPLKVAEI